MEKRQTFKSNFFKVFMVVAITAAIFKIFGGGHDFGQWLYEVTH